MNNFQDWKPVVLNATKKKAPPTTKSGDQRAFHKLDQSTEPEKVEYVSRNISIQLVAGRVAKKLSQKQLAQNLNIDIKTIQDIEQQRHKKDMALFQKIARHLNIKLVK